MDKQIRYLFKGKIGKKRLDFDPEKVNTLANQMIDLNLTGHWEDEDFGLRSTKLKIISRYKINAIISTIEMLSIRKQMKEYKMGYKTIK